ncbi:MAG: response regulator receiver protein, partial [Hyphomicrobiales bacterium]|nr:response regulator receiver protein [Hyphomicrobiales bacterium]
MDHNNNMQRNTREVIVVSPDDEFRNTVIDAIGVSGRIGVHMVSGGLAAVRPQLDLADARVLVVDIEVSSEPDLTALQELMAEIDGRIPVIVVTDVFDDAIARWLIQIRVADFLRKPVDSADLLRSCVKSLQTSVRPEGPKQSRIVDFIPAMGGVGATTLAIEAAIQLIRRDGAESTCLVDLAFQQSACADHLDIEPRFDFAEIARRSDRLDMHVLEVMLSKHRSGLTLLGALPDPASPALIDTLTLTNILDLVSSRFTNVIIDVPRDWRPWTDVVLAGSDDVFVVTDMTVPGLRAARRMVDSITERLHRQVVGKVIVNRFEQSMLPWSGLRKADIDKTLGADLAGTVSNNYRLVR